MHLKKWILFVFCSQVAIHSIIAAQSINIQYEQGDITYQDREGSIRVLNVNLDRFEEITVDYLIDSLTYADADVVYLSGNFQENIPAIVFENLKNQYAHFYLISSNIIERELQNTLIISKLLLIDFKNKISVSGFNYYDFTIIKNPHDHIHFDGFYKYSDEYCLLKEDLSFLTSPLKNGAILTTIHSENNNKKTRTARSHVTTYLLYRKNSNDRNYYEYEVSAECDNRGNASAQGSFDYVSENDNEKFSVGVDGKVSKDDKGESTASVGIHAGGRF